MQQVCGFFLLSLMTQTPLLSCWNVSLLSGWAAEKATDLLSETPEEAAGKSQQIKRFQNTGRKLTNKQDDTSLRIKITAVENNWTF